MSLLKQIWLQQSISCWVHQGLSEYSYTTAEQRRLPFIHTQTWSDNQGRYIAISGIMGGTLATIVSVYAPPPMSSAVLDRLGLLISQLPEVHLVIGGDFNGLQMGLG